MAKYAQKVVRVGLKREKGYMYYIDKEGDISRSPMGNPNRKREP